MNRGVTISRTVTVMGKIGCNGGGAATTVTFSGRMGFFSRSRHKPGSSLGSANMGATTALGSYEHSSFMASRGA